MAERPWHALTAREVLARLGSGPEGLTSAEARRRLQTVGPNEIRQADVVSRWDLFLAQFTSPLIYVLLAAAGISFATGESLDAVVILAIVVANAAIGFFQEYRAERALEALRALAAPHATVVRGGRATAVPSCEVVPGDIALVTAGDRIPADARVLEVANLQVEEAALTGESEAVRKQPQPVQGDAPLAEQRDMLFLGTTAATGRGRAVVTATGMETRMGEIARAVQAEPRAQTPLQLRLGDLGRRLGMAAIVLAGILIAIGAARGLPPGPAALRELFLTGVAAAVAFIPEGLPAVVTVVLAVGVQRMVRRNAIIRKLPAVETLGSATFICSDKTGTLTRNEMTVRALWLPDGEIDVQGEGYAPEGRFLKEDQPVEAAAVPGLRLLLTAAALCNDARLECEDGRWQVAGDPTEGALLTAGSKAGLDPDALARVYPRVAETPFDPDERYMATLHRGSDGEAWLFVKGAPERVLEMSAGLLDPETASQAAQDGTGGLPGGEGAPLRTRPLTEADRQRVRAANHDLASRALRVLAIACRRMPDGAEEIEAGSAPDDLVFVGLVGMMDPPRPDAVAAIEAARRAGIQVMMITGDHLATAQAIAAQLGLLQGGRTSIEGREIAAMSEAELERRVERIAACARAEPAHKLRIVVALQARGHVVAMTGDGVNDAPALKRADIGIAMGITGTDVAKEASEMILADDNFASIIGAVEEGRVIFSNIRRVVAYLLSTNSGEILTLLASQLAGLPLPLLPVQILWINLVTDGAPTVALSQEPPHARVLDRPPLPRGAGILNRALVYRMAFVALFMALGTLAVFAYMDGTRGLAHARTTAFATMALFQLLNVYNARSLDQSVFRIGVFSNRWVNWGVLASAALLVGAIHLPALATALGTVPLTAAEWGLAAGVASSVLVAEEIRKAAAPWLFATANEETRRTAVRVRI